MTAPKLKDPVNRNYAAVVARIRHIEKLENCDNVVGVPVFGYQAITGKDTKEGELVVVFGAETQLSHVFCSGNNLYREATLNHDTSKKGYVENNRRVKAVKFRGHRSDALIMPLASLVVAFESNAEGDNADLSFLKEGDVFDELNGVEICRKYEAASNKKPSNATKMPKARVDAAYMPEHVHTDNWFREHDKLPHDTELVLTQKLHGTSIRIGHVPVRRKLTWKDKIAKWLGVSVSDKEMAHVYGSRRVIKDANDKEQSHFYTHDIWTIEGRKLDDVVPENFILYGELISWTPDHKPIQQGYTYNLPVGRCHLYVYRIAIVLDSGRLIELPWDDVKKFCIDNGIKHTPELARLSLSHAVDFIPSYMDIAYNEAVLSGKLKSLDTTVPLSNKGTVDEGVCLRVLGSGTSTPKIYKAKSPMFLAHETKALDKEVEDIEATQ